ncbi:MAG TPA: hypothetical protein VII45_06585 [Solirubrobacterales bacterium]
MNTPPGFIGIPGEIPQCTAAEFATHLCPVDSQVGIVDVRIDGFGVTGLHAFQPLYNMVPGPGQLALLSFPAPLDQNVPIYTVVTLRTESDYGLEFETFGVPAIPATGHFALITWGVPASPVHDALRFPLIGGNTSFGKSNPCNEGEEILPELINDQYPEGCPAAWGPVESSSPEVPFLSSPTTCAGPLNSTIETLAYDLESDHGEAPYPAATGCGLLSFNPSLSAKPTTTEADSASGLDIDLEVPQFLNPTTPSPSEIRGTTVTLPPGFTINPNAADGKTACSDVAAKFGTRDQANCPEFAKIGTLAVRSSSLPGVLPGYVYLGQPLPGNRYRVFLVADGFSVHIKLAGTATLDPETGQVTVSFQNLPQAPFQEFDIHLFGSERGLFATPTHCGTYPVKSTFTPWDNELAAQSSTQFFTIDSGPGGTPCPGSTRPFRPAFSAGVADSTAGAHSPFSLELTRDDGDQSLTGLSVTTPPGWTATLKGIPYCPESAIGQLANSSYSGLAEQASPSCPAASQIGTATAGAGAGTHPLYVPGKVYLAGPYKGAPLSLVAVIPAVSGPYDLGDVAVRAAIEVDPTTAQVTTVSDPLPRIVEGIPLRTRHIQVNLDRRGFALNPTNCDPFSIDATASGDEGAVADLSSHFQVADCADLGFSPKLSLRLQGAKRTAHPALTTHLVYPKGGSYANVKTAQVTLPHSEFLDNAHIQAPCTGRQFAANACPPGSKVGFAKAETPLLDKPLEGPVYLRTSSHKLPDLVADLSGQFHVVLVGRVDAINERLRTTFETVPDVPVSGFTLSLFGGKRGLLVNSENLCVSPKKVLVRFGGQNGKSTTESISVKTSCGKAARHRSVNHAQRLAG